MASCNFNVSAPPSLGILCTLNTCQNNFQSKHPKQKYQHLKGRVLQFFILSSYMMGKSSKRLVWTKKWSISGSGGPREKKGKISKFNPLDNEQVKSSPALKVWSHEGSKLYPKMLRISRFILGHCIIGTITFSWAASLVTLPLHYILVAGS